MSRFRCRRCEIIVEDPLEHVEVFHHIPSTMAQVWEQFALVSSDHYRRTRNEAEPGPLDQPLFD